jgi:hypothetical protein
MSARKPLKSGIDLITEERQRQIDEEGYTPEHDDEHDKWEMVFAAISYAHASAFEVGALIAAEIDRLQRAERAFQEEGWRSQL